MSDFDVEDDPIPPPSRPVAVFGRSLPHSLEAEEHLLSCCLLDGSDVIARCHEARLRPESFFDTKHAIVFECLLDLQARQIPVDVSVVAEELKTRRHLDAIGGYAFLTQVSSRIPTTAQAGYFIDKVREQALLRDIIRSATGTVEDSYNFSGGINEFVNEVRLRTEKTLDDSLSASSLLAARKFNPTAAVVDERVVYRLGKVPVCTAGNLTNITAKSGVGKSAMLAAMIAAAIKHPKDTLPDTLGWVADENAAGLPVIHFDTEQSKSHYQKSLHRALKRSKAEAFPPWFHSYHLTGLTAPECREMVRVSIARHAKKSRIYAIFVDGWGDLVVDPNDTQECFPFVAEMHGIAIKHDCPIIGVLHLNPGTDKSRGHLGSQLDRKSESVINLDMDADLVTAVWATKTRGVPILKPDGPRFGWDNDKGMHVLISDWQADAAAKREAKAAAKKEKTPTAFAEKYSREEQVSFYPAAKAKPEPRAVIMRRAQEKTKISDRQLDRMRMQFLADQWITDAEGGYRRTADGDLWAARRPGANPPPSLPPEQVEF